MAFDAATAQKLWHVRWMIRRDVPEVLTTESLVAGSGGLRWTRDVLLYALKNQKTVGMVAERSQPGNPIGGFMVYRLKTSSLHVLNMAVHPEWSCSGVGLALVEKLKDKLSPHRRRWITFDVPERAVELQLLLKAEGFVAARIIGDRYRMAFGIDGEDD